MLVVVESTKTRAQASLKIAEDLLKKAIADTFYASKTRPELRENLFKALQKITIAQSEVERL